MKESTPDKKGPISRKLLLFGGILAIIEGIIFLVAIIDLITFDFQPGTIFQNNWLILIFKLGAGFTGVHNESLYVLNFLDIFLMAIFGIILFAIYPILRQISKI